MARRLRFVRTFALFSSLLLNPHAYCTVTDSLTLPMPIHPSTYFLHTHARPYSSILLPVILSII
jgi:hypothetical protein